MNPKIHELVILGSGPAGYTAAIYAARANLKPIVITGEQPGGQLTTTSDVDNWPGEEKGILGIELVSKLEEQAKRFGTRIISDHIESVDLSSRPFLLKSGKNIYKTKTLIIATGASAKYLGLKSEKKFLGRGLSSCATCDGFFYRGKNVMVVGGGNTAIEESMFLSKIAKKVTLVHRRDKLKGEKILINNLMQKVNCKDSNINIEWNSKIEEILGDKLEVNRVVMKNVISRKIETINIDGIFIAIGHTPNTKIFDKQVKMINGYIEVKSGINGNSTATSIEGVFAAGDVTDQIYKQAVTSASTGCMAALDAEKYLDNYKSS